MKFTGLTRGLRAKFCSKSALQLIEGLDGGTHLFPCRMVAHQGARGLVAEGIESEKMPRHCCILCLGLVPCPLRQQVR